MWFLLLGLARITCDELEMSVSLKFSEIVTVSWVYCGSFYGCIYSILDVYDSSTYVPKDGNVHLFLIILPPTSVYLKRKTT